MLYQHSNIIESGRVGRGVYVPNWQSWESMRRRFTIDSIFFFLKGDFYIKKSIPFLDIKKIDSWYQVIGLIFDIKKSDWFFSIIDFFHIKKWIFYIKITKYRINSKTAPRRAVLLFNRFFFILDMKKNINLSVWYKISARLFNQEFQFLI